MTENKTFLDNMIHGFPFLTLMCDNNLIWNDSYRSFFTQVKKVG